MIESPLFWPAKLERNALWVLDETLIPKKLHYIKVIDTASAVKVIRDMKTRAFGQLLVVINTFLLEIDKNSNAKSDDLLKIMGETAQALNKSRPTFPFSEVTGMVMGWAQQAVSNGMPVGPFVKKYIEGYLNVIRGRRLERVQKIAALIQNGDSILTHCNVSGELAMAAKLCQEANKTVKFFATETRPYLQGAKLTCWELKKMGADVTLVADNAIGTLMINKMVNKVIVGSDRNCANGDFANKIGTYQMAVLAQEFNIAFYVLTQPSNKVQKGEDIPIEIRDAEELLSYEGKRIIAGNVDAYYPAFDVVSKDFVTEPIAIEVGR